MEECFFLVQFDYDIDDFMSYCQCQNLRPQTMKSYEQTLRIFEHHLVDVHHVESAEDVK